MAIKKVSQQVIKEESWREIAATGNPQPSFSNGWINYSVAFNSAGFMKDAMGFVHLKGLIKAGTMVTPAFTLPAGYRPVVTNVFATNSGGGFGSVYVDTSGTVTPQVGNNTFVSLDGIIFRAEQ